MSSRKQASLTSFFKKPGSAPIIKKKQEKLNFNQPKKEKSTVKKNTKKSPVAEKCSEHIENDAATSSRASVHDAANVEAKASDDLMDTDDDDDDDEKEVIAKKKIVNEVSMKKEQANTKDGARSNVRRKKVFDDDSDSDEEEVEDEEMSEEEEEEAVIESESDDEGDDDESLDDLEKEEPDATFTTTDEKKRKKDDDSSDPEEASSSATTKRVKSANPKPSAKSKKKGSKDNDTPIINSTKDSELISHAESSKLSWTKGKPVPYTAIAEAFTAAEAISSRLAIQEIITKLFRTALLLKPEEVICLAYLCSNRCVRSTFFVIYRPYKIFFFSSIHKSIT